MNLSQIIILLNFIYNLPVSHAVENEWKQIFHEREFSLASGKSIFFSLSLPRIFLNRRNFSYSHTFFHHSSRSQDENYLILHEGKKIKSHKENFNLNISPSPNVWILCKYFSVEKLFILRRKCNKVLVFCMWPG